MKMPERRNLKLHWADKGIVVLSLRVESLIRLSYMNYI